MLPTLLDHLLWADRRTAESIETLADPPAELLRIWAHLLAAEATWLARLTGRTPPVPVWPTLTLPECRELMAANHAALEALAAGDPAALERTIDYTTSRGEPHRDVASHLLHHLAMHGMYHRGQLAMEIRRLGGAPRATDLVFYLREPSR
jgi:uncharacterized damage-inducible protein DinB